MITDIHFHIAAAETELPHFFVSEEQQQTFVYKALRDFLYPDLLYADLAAFFIPFSTLRAEGAVQVKRDFPMQCLVFGSDFPMLPFPLLGGHATHMDLDDILKVAWTSNPLDRNVRAFQALEYDDCVFSNFDKLLKVP
jgi:hypothetical protein